MKSLLYTQSLLYKPKGMSLVGGGGECQAERQVAGGALFGHFHWQSSSLTLHWATLAAGTILTPELARVAGGPCPLIPLLPAFVKTLAEPQP